MLINKLRGEDGKLRFIPTGVGNGVLEYIKWNGPAVHPHRRGERCL